MLLNRRDGRPAHFVPAVPESVFPRTAQEMRITPVSSAGAAAYPGKETRINTYPTPGNSAEYRQGDGA